ncbi:hypothetical protein LCGC14_0411500 [marine sediment metagenome]|uniref:AFP-like domain-containing protein n=1 Tax=marine sediment metagenome TaxID=412755 RepID=A0A0F9W2R2_9ZZZZ
MSKVFIIAEISANHNQSYERAAELVRTAKDVGADAVKLQTYTPDTMTIRSDRPEFVVGGGTPWDGETLYDLYQRSYMPWEWQPELKKLADEIGIELFSTPYDKTAVDFLEEMGVARYKIASFELVDLSLIEYVARKGKPMIMSTGMATLREIKNAVFTAQDAGVDDITLLKCTTAYPAPLGDLNLLAMPHIRLQFVGQLRLVAIGLSDHSIEPGIPVAAVALGATVIEKHLTLSYKDETPDSNFSLEPDEFNDMVASIRVVEEALGSRQFGPTDQETASNLKYRRSLYVVLDVKKGEKFTEQNVRSIRPSSGISPKYLPDVFKRVATRDIERGTPLSFEDFEDMEKRRG